MANQPLSKNQANLNVETRSIIKKITTTANQKNLNSPLNENTRHNFRINSN
jgi:hypothetical protein